jgi:hypothetical protein
MRTDELSSPGKQKMIEHLRASGHQFTFSIQSDYILCHDTQGCYSSDAFAVIELHVFGKDKNTRELIYGIQFNNGDKGIILGVSDELNAIEDPDLFSKLMVL